MRKIMRRRVTRMRRDSPAMVRALLVGGLTLLIVTLTGLSAAAQSRLAALPA
jgi:hypothetical protein